MKRCAGLFILMLLSACGRGTPLASLPTPHAIIETMTPSPILALVPPNTIQGLRERTFQSGVISILSTLYTGEDYSRYFISCPSDGWEITHED